MMLGTKRHDMLVEKIRERLENSPLLEYVCFQNTEYPHGELDLMARCDDSLLVFEVKASQRPRSRMKAHRQLDRAYKYAIEYSANFRYRKMYFFCVYGTKNGGYEMKHDKKKTKGEKNGYEIKRYMPHNE